MPEPNARRKYTSPSPSSPISIPLSVICDNLPPQITKLDLETAFSKFETLKEARIETEGDKAAKSKAVIEFATQTECDAALKEMNGTEVNGFKIQLSKGKEGKKSSADKTAKAEQQEEATA